MKHVIILIGPKGAGKTFIGKLIEKEFEAKFLDTEIIFKSLQAEGITSASNITSGYALVEKNIEKLMESNKVLIFESTGLVDEFWKLTDRLRNKYHVHLISITAPLDLCITRIKNRDQSKHISIDDEKIKMINKLAEDLNFNPDFTIDNSAGEIGNIIGEFNKPRFSIGKSALRADNL